MAPSATLYWFDMSHPAQAARLMLDRKGVDYRSVDLLAGFHPLLLRLAGFRGGSVPALKLDGRRLQGSLAISRGLEELVPEPPLFPADSGARQAVVQAESWGERELQPVPRRLNRWLLQHSHAIRRWFAARVDMPAPGVAAVVQRPLIGAFARISHADDPTVRADLQRLPDLLDHVDGLIGRAVIGGDQPNAADFQIGTSIWALMRFSDLTGIVEGRPAAGLVDRLLPVGGDRVPAGLPPEWLPPRRAEAGQR
jgi:glutathione S-transferase